MKTAKPSQVRRRSLYALLDPWPEEWALIVLISCAAYGFAVEAADSAPKGWPSWSKLRADSLAYGEGIAAVTGEDEMREGWRLLMAWLAEEPAPVTAEALEEALTPTEAATAARTTSSDAVSGPSTIAT